jgi:cytochrome b561
MRSTTTTTPKRYHPVLVSLHWLLAFMTLFALAMGSLKLQHIPNDLPEKLMALRGHMTAGSLILILTLIRLVVRLKTKHPAHIETNSGLLNGLAALMHYGLYLAVVLVVASGLVLAVEADLPAAVFGGSAALPADFTGFASRVAHGWIAKVLLLLIAGHILAAFYHQFIRKDGLLGRMWFGRK